MDRNGKLACLSRRDKQLSEGLASFRILGPSLKLNVHHCTIIVRWAFNCLTLCRKSLVFRAANVFRSLLLQSVLQGNQITAYFYPALVLQDFSFWKLVRILKTWKKNSFWAFTKRCILCGSIMLNTCEKFFVYFQPCLDKVSW